MENLQVRRFNRMRFASRYAGFHFLVSALVALASAGLVFYLLYPAPHRAMLGVSGIFVLMLLVDVTCGPLLTLVLASPTKSKRERWLDFSLIGLIQIAALCYGLHAVWVARPAVLAFEVDRLVVVTANEINPADLVKAPDGLRDLPLWGIQFVGTRRPANSDEAFDSTMAGLAGISLGAQPGWWTPWSQAQEAMSRRVKPAADLLARRPKDAAALQNALRASGLPTQDLRYLPLVNSKTLEWVALLDMNMNIVGYAPVDGF